MKADDLLRDPFLPRRALATIGFLRSCVRAGELIDPADGTRPSTTPSRKLKEVAYPPRDSGDATDDVVIDEHGQPVVLPLGVVRDQVEQIAIEGEQIASIFRRGGSRGTGISCAPR
jgi:hypothetical protein